VSEQSEVDSFAIDTSGNAFIIGKEGDVRVSKRYGAYVAKYDAEGTPLWGEALGLKGGEGFRDVAVAADGAVFVTGDYPDAPTGAFIVRVAAAE
jgi:glucose/arabinose dehydrogenase